MGPTSFRRFIAGKVDHEWIGGATIWRRWRRRCERSLSLGFGTGVVIGNPIAAENELPHEIYEQALAAALEAAEKAKVLKVAT